LRRKRKKSKKIINGKRTAVFFISLISIILIFVGVMGIGGIFSVEDDAEENVAVTPVDKETGKINILVVGLDKGDIRTDTILVASYDLDNDKVNILSIPRDTRMYVGGRYQKINCAYSISKNGKKNGINGTIEAVSRLTCIPINYYVEFSCNAFRETIDALGGIDFDVPQNMNYDDPYQDLHIHLVKGQQHLDGDKSEQLVRFRKYPMGDIDRVKVQQSFIKAVAEQKLNATILTKAPDLFEVLQDEIKTNFTLSSVTKYLPNLADLSSENITAYSLPGTADDNSYGASYWIANMIEIQDLIENTFGYDAAKATIHSADGSSVSKDIKISKPSADNTKTEKITNKSKETNKTEADTENKVKVKEEQKTDNKQNTKTDTNKQTDTNKNDTEKNSKTEENKDDVSNTQETKKGIKRPKANPTNEE